MEISLIEEPENAELLKELKTYKKQFDEKYCMLFDTCCRFYRFIQQHQDPNIKMKPFIKQYLIEDMHNDDTLETLLEWNKDFEYNS